MSSFYWQVLLKKIFGPDIGDQGLADMLHKIESLYQERYVRIL